MKNFFFTLNPLKMIGVQIFTSVIVGLLITTGVYYLDLWLGSDVITSPIALALWVLISLLFGLNEDEELNVPTAYAALVTFFGMRTPFILTEGKYKWIGRRLFLGRYQGKVPGLSTLSGDPLPDSKNGFFWIGEVVVPIWNKSTDDSTILSNVARDSSTVRTNLTIVFQIYNLRKWVSSSDPIFDIAERARETFRTAISYFVGTDCSGAKALLRMLMRGRKVFTCFIESDVGSCPRYSMIQSASGNRLYEVSDDTKTEAKAIADLKKTLSEADPTLMKAVPKIMHSGVEEPRIEERSILDHLDKVIRDLGAELKRVSISDFTLSEEVETRANKAAGETFEREAQIKSARAVRAAQEILKTPDGEERDELSTILAAAQDNPNIRVVYAPGADRLTRAAIAGGSQIGGGSK